MEIFRVPQQEIAARVSLQSGVELEGTLYAALNRPDGLPGRLIDRLDDREELFIPLACPPLTHLLNKRSIVSVEMALGAEPEFVEVDDHESTRQSARLRLSDGNLVEGWLAYSMPPARGRLIDFLNSGHSYVAVHRQESIVLVNVDHVVSAVGVDSDED